MFMFSWELLRNMLGFSATSQIQIGIERLGPGTNTKHTPKGEALAKALN